MSEVATVVPPVVKVEPVPLAVEPVPLAAEPVPLAVEPDMVEAAEVKSKKFRMFGRTWIEMKEKNAKRLLIGGLGFFACVNVLMLPFALPKWRRFLGAPFLPIEMSRLDLMFGHMLKGMPQNQPGKMLVDVGSGDGRIVIAAAQRGFHAVGYDINPWLVWKARRRAAAAGVADRCEFKCANIWTQDLSKADIVTLYGREGDGLMAKFRSKFEKELSPETLVFSNYFVIPGWERAMLADDDGMKLYDMQRVHEALK